MPPMPPLPPLPPATVDGVPDPSSASPASALRRGVVLWGAGHLAMGMRRGWLLLAAEVAFVAVLALFLLPRAAGTSDDLVFTAVALFFVAWAAQAVDAYRLAARGSGREPEPGDEPRARPGAEDAAGGATGIATGEPWIEAHGRAALLLLALVVPATLVFTAFWMVAGRGATPESALEHYIVAWRAGEPGRASGYLAAPQSPETLDAEWRAQEDRIASRLRVIAAGLDTSPQGGEGVDADRPFRNLEFVLESFGSDGPGSARDDAGAATAAINVVRRVQVHDTFLGLFPTASLRTVVIERIGTVRLLLVELPPPLGLGPADHAWRVESVEILPPS
jgi:hypothetical protein